MGSQEGPYTQRGKMKRLHLMLGAVFVGSFAFGFVGCGDVEQAFDCNSVCNKYQSCFNKDYDVGKCRDKCRDKISKDKADSCESCINDKSCASATFSCATECAGIVP
jgi:hypothetical protein